MLRRLTVWLLVATAAFAAAQSTKTIKIQFPGEGDREVWLQSKADMETVPETKEVTGKAVELKTSSTAGDLTVFVHDKDTGAVAEHLVSDLKDGAWAVKDGEYTLVRGARVTVATAKGLVASASVTMTLGDEKHQTLLTPSDKGVVQFNLLKPGDATLTATYKVGGVEKTSDPQTFTVKPTKGGWVPIKLLVPDGADILPAETPKASAAPAEAKAEPKKEEKAPNPVGLLVNMVIGLALVGGIGYGAWWYVTNHKDKVTEIMEKAGVPLNQDPADPTGAAPVPQAPKPIEKIVLGGADLGPATPSIQPTVVKAPRVTGPDGTTVSLGEGPNTVGREPGLAVSLVGESSVSRNHATMTRTGDSVVVEDQGSTNGTYLNGAKLTGPATLQPGDVVQFGAVAFRYEE